MIARLADRQHGVATRRQLLHAGLTPKAIDHRLVMSRLHPLHRGIYAVGHLAPSPWRAAQAALLACGPGSLLCFLTAAVLWELLQDEGRPIHVLKTGGLRRADGVVVHRAKRLPPHQLHHGLLVTTPLETIRSLRGSARERATDATLAKRLVRPRDIASPDGFTRSAAERLLLALVVRAQLPRPRTNVQVEGHEADACWADHRLVVEVDSCAHHSGRATFETDRAKDARRQQAGYRTLRITWRQLRDQPEAVAERLGAALAS